MIKTQCFIIWDGLFVYFPVLFESIQVLNVEHFCNNMTLYSYLFTSEMNVSIVNQMCYSYFFFILISFHIIIIHVLVISISRGVIRKCTRFYTQPYFLVVKFLVYSCL